MPQTLTKQLLDWYIRCGREMPWRVKGGAHPDAYAVWISEIMLQQTTVATVQGYFIRWMKKFPDVATLAKADLQEVLLAWQGLGYYTRARKIHECARVLMEKYNGKLPDNREELLRLPGIGPYTASSICCFAFNRPETVVDGNVMRVIARLRGITREITAPDIYPLAQALTSKTHGADYASAIMDLGATVCTPANPKCAVCPWTEACIARQKNLQEQIPVIKKLAKKEKFGRLYLIQNAQGEYLIRQRPKQGLLANLWEFPWEEVSALSLTKYPHVIHVFTHFKLTLELVRSPRKAADFPNAIWVKPQDFKNYPFPTLMQKVIKKL